MWWSRARLGLGAIVMALAWLAVPAVAAVAGAGVAQPDEGTLQVSPAAVQASAATPLALSFTEPASPPSTSLIVIVSMPAGWTAVPPSSADLGGCVSPACSLVSASTEEFEVLLTPGANAFTLNVLATPPPYATSSSFTAVERFHSNPPATFEVTAPVTVACPTDGLGTIQVAPSSVPAATSTNFTFTYTAGSCGAGDGGTVTVTVPPGWTPPSAGTPPGTPGLVTWTGNPQVSVVAGSMIVVPIGNLAQGTVITFEYWGAQAPGSSVPYTFAAGQAASGEPSQPLVSPTVMVTVAATTPPGTTTPPAGTTTPPAGTTTPPAGTTTPPSVVTSTPAPQSLPPGPATMTVTPVRVTASRPSTLRFTYTAQAGLSPSGEVVVQVPAGWTAPSWRRGQAGYASASGGLLTVSGRRITVTGETLGRGQQLTITYAAGTAPGAAGVATFLTWQRPDGTATLAALPVSPQVTVALAGAAQGQPASWLPLLLVVMGLVLVAGTAGLAAFRPLRRGGHGAAGGDVRAVPHTGPPPSVAVRDTGDRPALTVRLEPRASATVTTIEEGRP
jgi:hypothetical protein